MRGFYDMPVRVKILIYGCVNHDGGLFSGLRGLQSDLYQIKRNRSCVGYMSQMDLRICFLLIARRQRDLNPHAGFPTLP